MSSLVIAEALLDVCRKLPDGGRFFIVMEHNVAASMSLADRCYIIRDDRIVSEHSSEELAERPEIVNEHLAV